MATGERTDRCTLAYFRPHPRYWHFASIKTLRTLEVSLLFRLSFSSPLQAPRCAAIQHPELTPAGRTAHGRNQDKPVSLCCLAPAIERERSQCSY
jgi:hypothetical protein